MRVCRPYHAGAHPPVLVPETALMQETVARDAKLA
jgi:hypothetical protein